MPYNAATTAYIADLATNGGTLATYQTDAVDAFIVGGISDGFWSKLTLVAFFLGNNINGVLTKAKYPSGSSLFTNNGFTYSDYNPLLGLKGNGTSKYLGSGFNDTTALVTSFSLGVDQTAVASAGSKVSIGELISGTSIAIIRSIHIDSSSEFSIGGTGSGYTPLTGLGLLIASNTATALTGTVNGSQLGATTTTTGTLGSQEVYIFAANTGSSTAGAFTNATIDFAFIGTGLSAGDQTNLYNRLVTYKAAVTPIGILSSTINSAGTQLTVVFNKSVTGVSATDFNISPTYNGLGSSLVGETLTGVSGSGTTYTFTISPTVYFNQQRSLNYTGTAVVDSATGTKSLSAISNLIITNNSNTLLVQPSSGTLLTKSKFIADAVLNANAFTYNGLITYRAASGYPPAPNADGYPLAALDLIICTSIYPAYFTDSQIEGHIDLLCTNLDGHGNPAIFIYPDGTKAYQSGGPWLVPPAAHAVGDANWALSGWLYDLLQRNVAKAIAKYNLYKTIINTLIQGLPTDAGNSGLLWIDPSFAGGGGTVGTLWPDHGFHDGLTNSGFMCAGSVELYKTCKYMAAVATAAGDFTNAAIYTTRMNKIVANIGTLLDGSTGLLLICSGGPNNANPDVFFSAAAVSYGLITGAPAKTIGTYICTNIASLTNAAGKISQSTFPFVITRSDQPFISGGTETGYDKGRWGFKLYDVVVAMLLADNGLTTVNSLLTTILAGADITQEWIDSDVTKTTNHGKSNNISDGVNIYVATQAYVAALGPPITTPTITATYTNTGIQYTASTSAGLTTNLLKNGSAVSNPYIDTEVVDGTNSLDKYTAYYSNIAGNGPVSSKFSAFKNIGGVSGGPGSVGIGS